MHSSCGRNSIAIFIIEMKYGIDISWSFFLLGIAFVVYSGTSTNMELYISSPFDFFQA